MELGNQIRALRTRRGMTQEALAAVLNVSAQTVSKWECGTTLPDVQLLPELSVFFGVSIDELFSLTTEAQLERIGNRIDAAGLLDAAEAAQLEQTLRRAAQDPTHKARALTLLAALHNSQAAAHRTLAAGYGKEAAQANPDSADAIRELCNAMGSAIPDWNAANHHELIGWLSGFLQRHPGNRSACLWLLDNLLADQRLEEAAALVEQLATVDDTFRTPLYRGLLAQAQGDGAAAEAHWRQMTELWPEDWMAWFSLGDIHARAGRWVQAVGCYRRALAQQQPPRYVDVPCSIAHICEITGDRAGALAAYDEALALLRDDWGLVEGAAVDDLRRHKLALEG